MLLAGAVSHRCRPNAAHQPSKRKRFGILRMARSVAAALTTRMINNKSSQVGIGMISLP